MYQDSLTITGAKKYGANMIHRLIFIIFQRKNFRPWKLFILLLSLTTVSFIFSFYLETPIYFKKLEEQSGNSINILQEIINSVQHSVFAHEQFGSSTNGCPYYGPQHGLFHPSVEHPRFIITGGAGFIGSHLVKRLRQQQYKARQIKVLDNLWRGNLHNLQFENGTWAISTTLDFCLVDLRNANDTLKFVTGADVIFHLADVVTGVNYVFSHQISVFRNNILINSNTLHAAKTNKVQNFIYVGTACSFPKFLQDGTSIRSLRKEQTYPTQPESSYGWSKLMGEYETESAKSDDFNVGILRLHNVYGPYSDYTATTGQVIPSLIRKALNYKNDSFKVWGSGEQYRDFIYVEDVVDSLILILKRGMNKGVIQVGTAKATTIKQLAHIINKLVEAKLQRKINITFDTTQPEGDRGRIAILDRAKSILKWQPKVDIKEGVSATMSWITKNQRKQRVLVIIIGQVRGGDLAWKSLHKFLLRPLNAHLAIYISNWQTRTFLHNISQYIWTVPEYVDWGVVFEAAAKLCNVDNVADKWRNYCKIPGIFMGGVVNCSHPGSAGILLAFRWLVQQKILELNLLDKYDWFILTRADELYLCNHHDFFVMNKNHVLLPTGEYYEGWSDRHIIGKSSSFMKMINITTELICKPDYWFKILKQYGGEFNLEKIQKVLWSLMNITVSEFPRSMFTVRTQHDSTRWSKGQPHPDVGIFGLKLKYPDEFTSAIKHCNIKNVTNALEVIKQYGWEKHDILSS
jgi:GDP-D-mannose 3',5'-epimerase